ncbi:poly-gamma-glutamate synthase PgsB [Fusibacter paucivorans]|uniref:Poly-gamma-glutamate synthase PgsB n=1 Tax=Fusibacter paucivorans TaxID=76009 RepID=A0ABS5PLG8_9FIRM|nr:poly-gamma-glutamate synthase PgsB [Fusibacter paucivorans]MBS7525186.1 poly-gamma-glutamate synthase PgsB [Fusibacter paucivorans]
MMVWIALLLLGILTGLFFERQWARKRRKKLKHVVYVNGTRGKTTVARLIDSGLRAGGYRVFCKTTGTVPRIIDVDNRELPLKRVGNANIKEQLKALKMAVNQSAEILVCECMAITPELQRITQDEMLQSDIGVITNVRQDHAEVMGDSLTLICDALSNTIPKKGILFTADSTFFERLKSNAAERETPTVLAESSEDLPDVRFKENVALAVAVCEHLGVSRSDAIRGVQQFRMDPYDLKLFQMPNGVLFANAMAANDAMSIQKIYEAYEQEGLFIGKHRILLINNRWDRGARAKQLIDMAASIEPDEIWLMGGYQHVSAQGIEKRGLTIPVKHIKQVHQTLLQSLPSNTFVFAVGNIAGGGIALMNIVESEGVVIGK